MTISRRDFLKFSSLLTASALFEPGPLLLPSQLSADPDAKNVLVIVFDALSATNINFYGYPRETMPNLTRLLSRAAVFHNHYASANFTTPGTASLLTGRHPWEHLALKLSDITTSTLDTRSIFGYFDQHYKIAITHNHFVDYLLNQFRSDITLHEDRHTVFLEYAKVRSSLWFDNLMSNHLDEAMLLKSRLADSSLDGYLYSLLFPSLLTQDHYQLPAEVTDLFPRGLPEGGGQFILEDAIDWTIQQTTTMPQPFLGYFHFLPPHSPYNTRMEYIDAFLGDDYHPPKKPRHPVVIQNKFHPPKKVRDKRRLYDEFLLYVDSEFHRLFTYLDKQGILNNTLLVFTSDHGEMFERRTLEHGHPYLFDPVIKVPLIIFEPGQFQRTDIHTPTSCVDLLPTLLHYTGQQVPSSLPGQILPTFSEHSADLTNTIYAMDARWNQDYSHIKTATLMMRKENLKILRYSNYANYYRDKGYDYKYDSMLSYQDPYYEVYNLESDPEELTNLALSETPEIQELIDEMENYYRENVEYPQ